MTLAPGMRVGPYEILGRIGAGGMGEVYRARDSRLQRDVAIKTLPPVFAGDDERISRFERQQRCAPAAREPLDRNTGEILAGRTLACVRLRPVGRLDAYPYDVTPDGQQFLSIRSSRRRPPRG